MIMQWEQLYTPRRTGSLAARPKNADSSRNSYMRDYDRVIFSSAFRRLQNKTQVFPLPGPVFVHNRLTHSLEVASVGRSLGKIVGEQIAARYPDKGDDFSEFYRHELAYVIASACLAHDIGNPPFGHSGEDAIRSFFLQPGQETLRQLSEGMTRNQLLDLQQFEGNSNAFRTLTHHFSEPQPGGYRLTYTTLASIVKYPCTSEKGFRKGQGIHLKKSGFFDREKATFRSVAEEIGIPEIEQDVFARHPFVYLVEAADDICYRVIDMEDAHRLGIVSIDKFMNLFLPFFDTGDSYVSLSQVRSTLDGIADPNQKVQYVRASWIGLMVSRMAALFMQYEEQLLQGVLHNDLLSLLPEDQQRLIREINAYSFSHIYNHKAVVEIEISGFHVIGYLLKEFIHAVLNPRAAKSEKLLLLIPVQFPVRFDGSLDLYDNIQSVVDFIAGMTDLFAVDLYRKISGISIANL